MLIEILNTLILVFFFITLFILAKHCKEKNIIIKILLWYVSSWAICSIVALTLYYLLNNNNNLFLFHFFVPVQYGIIALFFFQVFEKKYLKHQALYSIYFFCIVCLLLSLFVQKTSVNNSYAAVIESVLVIVWVLLYLRQVFSSNVFTPLHTKLAFWISTGLLIHFVGKLFIQGTINYLIDINMAQKIYPLEYIFDYLLLLSINVGVYSKKIFKWHK